MKPNPLIKLVALVLVPSLIVEPACSAVAAIASSPVVVSTGSVVKEFTSQALVERSVSGLGIFERIARLTLCQWFVQNFRRTRIVPDARPTPPSLDPSTQRWREAFRQAIAANGERGYGQLNPDLVFAYGAEPPLETERSPGSIALTAQDILDILPPIPPDARVTIKKNSSREIEIRLSKAPDPLTMRGEKTYINIRLTLERDPETRDYFVVLQEGSLYKMGKKAYPAAPRAQWLDAKFFSVLLAKLKSFPWDEDLYFVVLNPERGKKLWDAMGGFEWRDNTRRKKLFSVENRTTSAAPQTLMQEGTKRQINVWLHSEKRVLRFLGNHPALAVFIIEDLGLATTTLDGVQRPLSQAIMEGILPMIVLSIPLRLMISANDPNSEYFVLVPVLVVIGFIMIVIGQAEFVLHHDNKSKRQRTIRAVGTFLRGAATLAGYGLVYYADHRFFGGQHKALVTAGIVLAGCVMQIVSGGLAHAGWNAFWRWRKKEEYRLEQGSKDSDASAGRAAAQTRRPYEREIDDSGLPDSPAVFFYAYNLPVGSPFRLLYHRRQLVGIMSDNLQNPGGDFAEGHSVRIMYFTEEPLQGFPKEWVGQNDVTPAPAFYEMVLPDLLHSVFHIKGCYTSDHGTLKYEQYYRENGIAVTSHIESISTTQVLLRKLGPVTGLRLLDGGGGISTVGQFALEQGAAQVVMYDPNPLAVWAAKYNGRRRGLGDRLLVFQADRVDQLPASLGPFDVITSVTPVEDENILGTFFEPKLSARNRFVPPGEGPLSDLVLNGPRWLSAKPEARLSLAVPNKLDLDQVKGSHQWRVQAREYEHLLQGRIIAETSNTRTLEQLFNQDEYAFLQLTPRHAVPASAALRDAVSEALEAVPFDSKHLMDVLKTHPELRRLYESPNSFWNGKPTRVSLEAHTLQMAGQLEKYFSSVELLQKYLSHSQWTEFLFRRMQLQQQARSA